MSAVWNRLERDLPWAIPTLVFLVAVATLRDYGLTIDEPFEASTGDAFAHFLSTWHLADLPADDKLGIAFNLVSCGASHLFTALGANDPYLGRHACIVLVGVAGLVGTYQVGRAVWSPRVGILAMVLLAATPRYYGQIFHSPKDIPFAAAFVWAVWGLVRLLLEPTRRRAVLAGALAALCVAVRPQGMVFVLAGVAACAWPLASPGESEAEPLARRMGAFLAVVLGLTIVLWPTVVRSPGLLLVAPFQVSDTGAPPGLFLGKLHEAADQPLSYLAVWLAVTLPLPMLLGVAAGAFLSEPVFRRTSGRKLGWMVAVPVVWLLVPIALPAVHPFPHYHAIQLFLFILPALALVAAFGLDKLASLPWVRAAPWRVGALAAVIVVGLLDVGVTEVRLHPYEGLYFSRLVGGVGGAAKSFDVAYDGEAYGEAVRWVATEGAMQPARVTAAGGPLTMQTFDYYARLYRMDLDTPALGYFVAQVQAGHEKLIPGEVAHTVEREGVPLAVVVRPPPFTVVRHAWRAAPMQRVDAVDGQFPLQDAGDMLVVTLTSPTDQVVPAIFGYAGQLDVAVNPARSVIRLHEQARPMFPADRADLPLKSGSNAILVRLEAADRAAGLVLEVEADKGVTFVLPSPSP